MRKLGLMLLIAMGVLGIPTLDVYSGDKKEGKEKGGEKETDTRRVHR